MKKIMIAQQLEELTKVVLELKQQLNSIENSTVIITQNRVYYYFQDLLLFQLIVPAYVPKLNEILYIDVAESFIKRSFNKDLLIELQQAGKVKGLIPFIVESIEYRIINTDLIPNEIYKVYVTPFIRSKLVLTEKVKE